MLKIDPSEITPEHLYLSRRRFMKGVGALAVGSLLAAACGSRVPSPTPTTAAGAGPTPRVETTLPGPAPTGTPGPAFPPLETFADELGADLTSFDLITSYNNFFEFTTQKSGVDRRAQGLRTSPWTVEVGGLVQSPRTFDLDDLFRLGLEERVYRMRCVEAWSMVIPWVGFPLARLLREVEPLSTARYVRFETLYDPEQMPGQRSPIYQWPYVEGLRLDEAMNDLAILATGLYGKPLLPQNGAPVRLVVPWKYGFKSIKSIVKIDLVEDMPVSLWMAAIPEEYGFWANVNPQVPHPRWSQANERRIGESGRRPTLLFNGYADEVAHLYQPPGRREWYY